MVWARRRVAVPAMILLTGTAQCGSGSDAPPGQALLYIDTDAPSAALSTEEGRGFLAEASVDTLRIDVLGPDNEELKSVDVAAPDESNWPVSFGLRGIPGATVSRLRLRAFRAQHANIVTDPATGAKKLEPIAGYTIDRVVEVPVPSDKGVFAFRVVLRSECRGQRPDFTQRTTCVGANEWNAGYRDAIEAVPISPPPYREPMWWPSDVQRVSDGDEMPPDCGGAACPHDSVCVPGGFFMLGNLRVVGFGTHRDAVPAHPVTMRPFCMDRTEVTIGRYLETMAPASPSAPWPDGVTGKRDIRDKELCTWLDRRSETPSTPSYPDGAPVNFFTREQASEACKRAGGRLPTEAEWEYVATGLGRGSLFPWGDEPATCDAAVLEQQDTEYTRAECGHHRLGVVDERSAAGDRWKDVVATWWHGDGTAGGEVWHMAGSLSEWTLDSFVSYAESTPSQNCWQREGMLEHPSCALTGNTSSIRGGSFEDSLETAYSALRGSERDDAKSEKIGFRCVYPIGLEDPVKLLFPPRDDELDAGVAGEPEGDR